MVRGEESGTGEGAGPTGRAWGLGGHWNDLCLLGGSGATGSFRAEKKHGLTCVFTRNPLAAVLRLQGTRQKQGDPLGGYSSTRECDDPRSDKSGSNGPGEK